MAEEKKKDQTAERAKTPKRRLVPDIPAIQNFLKKELDGNFAAGLKRREKKEAIKAITPPMSLDEKFHAMLLADTKAREEKGKGIP